MTQTITGLVGYPTSHSLSPRIHAYWIAEHGLDADYKLFTTKPARLRQTMHHMRSKHWRGLNITVPHKQTVMEYLDDVDPSVRRIGAINTVTNEGGKLIGTNTDAYGFITNLREHLNDLTPYLKEVVILGAGGATRAAIVALQDAGAKSITLLNRTHDTAKTLAEKTGTTALPWDVRNDALADATLLVNTTSLGMENHPALDLALDALPTTSAVHDIVYAPLETALLTSAKTSGHPTVDGLGMLLYQAQRAFKEWHGFPAVTPELRAHLLQTLHEPATPSLTQQAENAARDAQQEPQQNEAAS